MTITATLNPKKALLLPYLALGVAAFALSLSAMFARWADAPGPVTAMYRLGIASALLLPIFVHNQKSDRTVTARTLIFPVLAGLFTACDFGVWFTSVSYTTAGNATLLGNTSPLWVALAAWLVLKRKLRKRFWAGLMLAVGGASLVIGSDFFLHPKMGFGDLLATSAGIFYAGYFLVTEKSRRNLDALSHMWIVTLSGTLGLMVINMALGHRLGGYSLQTWLVFIATALVSQILGYISMTYALGHLPAQIVSATMVLSPVITTLLAIPLLGEIPTTTQWVGGGIALAGILFVNLSYQPEKMETGS
jgi:drug/metabolite transporter (DMT)-like permease